MNTLSRDLLLIDPLHCFDPYICALESTGWHIHPHHILNQSLEFCLPPVGLISLANPLQQEILQVGNQRLAESSQIEWVAAFEGHKLNDHEFCRDLAGRIYDYHTLPIDEIRLLHTLGHAFGIAQLHHDNALDLTHDFIQGEQSPIIGQSAIMQSLFQQIQKMATVDAPVLITGESGTGKELAARTIHERSKRKTGPFVAINCGAMPTQLIQSELFGHEKGAFTGAVARKIGSIESSDRGTLFLDEIGELPVELQVNLLRFLQEKTIRRLGDTVDRVVDVRIIAATHVNLEEAIKLGKFREDLYYRIHVLHLNTPPLREREADIELLASYYFEQFRLEKNARVRGFSKAALSAMHNHPWEGNVREMINRIRAALIMCENRLIMPADLGLAPELSSRQVFTLENARDRAEKQAIVTALHVHQNNIAKSAAALGISRVTLYRLLEKHQLAEHLR